MLTVYFIKIIYSLKCNDEDALHLFDSYESHLWEVCWMY